MNVSPWGNGSFLEGLGVGPRTVVAAIVVSAIAMLAYTTLGGAPRTPDGFAEANGRIEVERIDIATKLAGRVAEVLVREGDDVANGAIVAQMDVAEQRAQLASAKAAARRAAEVINRALAEVALREAEHTLSELELGRVKELARRQVSSTADLDRRTAQHAIAEANLLGAKASVGDATAAKESAEAQVTQLEVAIADMTLRVPVAGRIEYKLVQPGTVIASGARVATLLDLSDVYMSIFLPTSQAGRVAVGAEARIVLDAAPRYVIPATVSFVAAEAQFTPKTVETLNEREKLMYRVKLRIDAALLSRYRDQVKAGLTGLAHVRLDGSKAWPRQLVTRLPDAK
jgi:HlyD family secretion protein